MRPEPKNPLSQPRSTDPDSRPPAIDPVTAVLNLSPEPPRPEADVPFPELLARFSADPRSFLNRLPGLLVFDKPSGTLSSHQVVDRVRRWAGLRRVGHAGTLDPLASGVLLVLLGAATRLFDACQAWDKTYRARFRLGCRTDTRDITGQPLTPGQWQPRMVPPVPKTTVEETLTVLRGAAWQTPPMHSALKRHGRPLYRLAREGIETPREPRPARVVRLALSGFDGTEGTLEMTVGSGFYVRVLVDDLGTFLGCGAVMTALRRLSVGPFDLRDRVPWPWPGPAATGGAAGHGGRDGGGGNGPGP